MGNISHVVTALHGYISLGPAGVVGNTHSPEFAPSTVAESGRKALLDAAAAMAMTVVDLVSDPGLLESARLDFSARKGQVY